MMKVIFCGANQTWYCRKARPPLFFLTIVKSRPCSEATLLRFGLQSRFWSDFWFHRSPDSFNSHIFYIDHAKSILFPVKPRVKLHRHWSLSLSINHVTTQSNHDGGCDSRVSRVRLLSVDSESALPSMVSGNTDYGVRVNILINQHLPILILEMPSSRRMRKISWRLRGEVFWMRFGVCSKKASISTSEMRFGSSKVVICLDFPSTQIPWFHYL